VERILREIPITLLCSVWKTGFTDWINVLNRMGTMHHKEHKKNSFCLILMKIASGARTSGLPYILDPCCIYIVSMLCLHCVYIASMLCPCCIYIFSDESFPSASARVHSGAVNS
jgi:hypothetical protein